MGGKTRRGRPPRVFDERELELVEKLASHGHPIAEIADMLQAAAGTCSKNHDFLTAYKRGQNELKTSLRAKMVRLAESGNFTALIYLYKSFLKESDDPVGIQLRKAELQIKRHELKVKQDALKLVKEYSGSVYYDRQSTDQPPLEYIVWDASLQSNFEYIKTLMHQLYTLSEMGSAMLGDFSATACGGPLAAAGCSSGRGRA